MRRGMAVCFAGASGGCGAVLRKTIGMRSAIGLRHPASASCLGRHLRLAGRCPNNSSLFPPLAAVVVVVLCAYSAEELFIIEQCRAVCGPPGIAFSRVGFWNELPQSKPDGFARFPFLSSAVTSVPLFVTCGDISPRRGENLSRPGEVVLWDGASGTPENIAL